SKNKRKPRKETKHTKKKASRKFHSALGAGLRLRRFLESAGSETHAQRRILQRYESEKSPTMKATKHTKRGAAANSLFVLFVPFVVAFADLRLLQASHYVPNASHPGFLQRPRQ